MVLGLVIGRYWGGTRICNRGSDRGSTRGCTRGVTRGGTRESKVPCDILYSFRNFLSKM